MDITSSGSRTAVPALMPTSTDPSTADPRASQPRVAIPAGVTCVPTENVTLLTVALPMMPARQRRASIGFAVEDRIAQPLEEVEVVLGPSVAPGVWLVAVTARKVLETMPKPANDDVLWPDVLLIPAPQVGWAVWVGSGRVLVRLPDGTGLAVSSAALPVVWEAAGSPQVTSYGGSLPANVPVTTEATLPETTDPTLAGFDLRASLGDTNTRLFIPRNARAFLLVVCAAALAHLSLLVLDVLALNRLAGQRAEALRTALAVPAGGDLDAALAEALSARQPTLGDGGVLRVLSGVFTAIAPEAGRVSLQDLRYDAAASEAVFALEAPDLATLQAADAALSATGLSVTAGIATTRDGAAEVQMTIRAERP